MKTDTEHGRVRVVWEWCVRERKRRRLGVMRRSGERSLWGERVVSLVVRGEGRRVERGEVEKTVEVNAPNKASVQASTTGGKRIVTNEETRPPRYSCSASNEPRRRSASSTSNQTPSEGVRTAQQRRQNALEPDLFSTVVVHSKSDQRACALPCVCSFQRTRPASSSSALAAPLPLEPKLNRSRSHSPSFPALTAQPNFPLMANKFPP